MEATQNILFQQYNARKHTHSASNHGPFPRCWRIAKSLDLFTREHIRDIATFDIHYIGFIIYKIQSFIFPGVFKNNLKYLDCFVWVSLVTFFTSEVFVQIDNHNFVWNNENHFRPYNEFIVLCNWVKFGFQASFQSIAMNCVPIFLIKRVQVILSRLYLKY